MTLKKLYFYWLAGLMLTWIVLMLSMLLIAYVSVGTFLPEEGVDSSAMNFTLQLYAFAYLVISALISAGIIYGKCNKANPALARSVGLILVIAATALHLGVVLEIINYELLILYAIAPIIALSVGRKLSKS
jgi:hypothetical protein